MLDVSKTCRTCMKSDTNLVDLNEPLSPETSAGLQLGEALMQCTSMLIVQDDGLPQRICEECTSLLRNSHLFRCQALESEAKIKEIILMQSNTVKIEEPHYIQGTYDSPETYSDDCNYTLYELMQEMEENQCFGCEICSASFNTEKEFYKHMKTHKKKTYKCNECSKSFRKKSSLESHCLIHSEMSQVPCPTCHMFLPDASKLVEHMVEHSQEIDVKTEHDIDLYSPYTCDKCGGTFKTSRALSSHIKKHRDRTMGVKLLCDECHCTFSNKSQLRRHMRLHSGITPFKCTKCEKSFTRRDQLRDHIKRHDGLRSNICPYCSKAFLQQCNLKDHIRTHTGETPYLCAECGRGFKNSSNLRQHQQRHTGDKPYACTLCPKTFTTKGSMTTHLATHTGAQPYKCDQCGASFTKPSSLKKHKLRHMGVKPHQCDVCAMRFTDKNHLKRHQRIHTGEKPYVCEVCFRAFTQSNDLLKHMRIHLGTNIYKCSVCDMSFRLQKELKSHYPSHYADGGDLDSFDSNFTEPIEELKPATNVDADKENNTEASLNTTLTTAAMEQHPAVSNSYLIENLPEKS